MLKFCLMLLLVASCKTRGTSSAVMATDDDDRFRCWSGTVEKEDVLKSFYKAVSLDYQRFKGSPGQASFSCDDLKDHLRNDEVFLDLHALSYEDNDFYAMFSHLKSITAKPRIVGLDLSFNRLSSFKVNVNVPGVSGNIQYLDLSHNALSGNFEQYFPEATTGIPSVYRKLLVLDVSHNAFTGEVSDDILQSFAGIVYLDLSGNTMTRLTVNSTYRFMRHLDFGRQDNAMRGEIRVLRRMSSGAYALDLNFLGFENGFVNLVSPDAIRAGTINMRRANADLAKTYTLQASFIDARGWGKNLQINYANTPLIKFWNSDCAGEATGGSGKPKCTEQGDMPPGDCGVYTTLRTIRAQLTDAKLVPSFDDSLKPYAAYCS